MYFMSDPQALHVTRNVIPGKLGVDLHLHRVHIPLVLLGTHQRKATEPSRRYVSIRWASCFHLCVFVDNSKLRVYKLVYLKTKLGL